MGFNFKKHRFIKILIITVFLLLIIPRFVDIMKFLPVYSLDENDIVEFGVQYMGGDLEQRFHNYGPLYAYLLTIVYYIIYFFQSIFGGLGFEDFVQQIFSQDRSIFYYTARFINSIIHILIPYVLYRFIGKRFSREMGLLVMLLGLAPMMDLLINFKVRVDTLLTLWTVLTFIFACQYYDTGKTKYYLISGIFVGLSLATKPLTAVLILPPLGIMHIARIYNQLSIPKPSTKKVKKKKAAEHLSAKDIIIKSVIKGIAEKEFYLLLITGVVVSFIFNPFSLIKFSEFFDALVLTVTQKRGGNKLTLSLFRFINNMGYAFVFSSLAAVVYSFWRRNKYIVFASLYVLIFYFAFYKGGGKNYFYPMIVPFLVMINVYAISDLFTNVLKVNKPMQITALFVLLLSAQPIATTLMTSYDMNIPVESYENKHSSIAARKWIEANIPRGEKIFMYAKSGLPQIINSRTSASWQNEMKKDPFLNDLASLIKQDPKSGPLVIDQASFGEYFMYNRSQNRFLVEQFMKWHQKLMRTGIPTYPFYQLKWLYTTANQEYYEENIYYLMKNHGIKYMVTFEGNERYIKKDNSVWKTKAKVVKRFSSATGYKFGGSIIIYQVI